MITIAGWFILLPAFYLYSLFEFYVGVIELIYTPVHPPVPVDLSPALNFELNLDIGLYECKRGTRYKNVYPLCWDYSVVDFKCQVHLVKTNVMS